MIYQETVDLIRSCAQEVNPDGTFINGRRADASIQYGDQMPQVHLYPFTTREDEDDNVRSIILMSFLDQDSPDSSPEQREAIISQMEALSGAFVDKVRSTSGVSIEGTIEREPQYRTMQGTLSGYAVRFTLLSKGYCPPDPEACTC